MAKTALRMYGPALVATGPTTIITAPASTTYLIREIIVSNAQTDAAYSVTLSVGADAAGTRVVGVYFIPKSLDGNVNIVRLPISYLPVAAAEIVTVSASGNNKLNITVSGDSLTVG